MFGDTQLSDASELHNISADITNSSLGPSDTIASDYSDSDKPKRKRSNRRTKSQYTIEPEIEEQPESNVSYAQMGAVMANCFFSLCMVIGGPDWKPDNSESQAMEAAWAGYFEAKGIEQLSPELMLGIVITGYGGKRLMMPTTQSRLKTLWERWKRRRNPYQQNARSDSGNNNVGENNSSAEAGSGPTQ